jgi:hypothetical protein
VILVFGTSSESSGRFNQRFRNMYRMRDPKGQKADEENSPKFVELVEVCHCLKFSRQFASNVWSSASGAARNNLVTHNNYTLPRGCDLMA